MTIVDSCQQGFVWSLLDGWGATDLCLCSARGAERAVLHAMHSALVDIYVTNNQNMSRRNLALGKFFRDMCLGDCGCVRGEFVDERRSQCPCKFSVSRES
jgi:hypothetical protein